MNKRPEPILDPDKFALPKCTIEVKLVGGVIFVGDGDIKKYDNYLKEMKELLLDPVPLSPFMYSKIQKRKRQVVF